MLSSIRRSQHQAELVMTGFVLRIVVVALGLWLAAELLPGLNFSGPGTLFAAALLLGIVNAVVRPIAIVLGLVALMLSGFQISGFWTAVGASLIVSIVSWAASGLLNDKGNVEVMKLR
jgi:putative membrane protein